MFSLAYIHQNRTEIQVLNTGVMWEEEYSCLFEDTLYQTTPQIPPSPLYQYMCLIPRQAFTHKGSRFILTNSAWLLPLHGCSNIEPPGLMSAQQLFLLWHKPYRRVWCFLYKVPHAPWPLPSLKKLMASPLIPKALQNHYQSTHFSCLFAGRPHYSILTAHKTCEGELS